MPLRQARLSCVYTIRRVPDSSVPVHSSGRLGDRRQSEFNDDELEIRQRLQEGIMLWVLKSPGYFCALSLGSELRWNTTAE